MSEPADAFAPAHGQIRTVLGDIAPETAGVVDSHDHLFLSTPLLQGEALDDVDDAETQARDFARLGGGTIIQWTPRGLGRDLAALRRVSAQTGVHVVAATGRHRLALYDPMSPEPGRTIDDLTRVFVADIEEQRCGFVKVGVGESTVSPEEDDTLRAAAAAHHATGAPVAVHLEGGSASAAVLDRLAGLGVSTRSIVLGHLGRNPDASQVVEAARSGAWICLDGPSPRHPTTHGQLGDLVGLLISEGHGSQLLLGADTTTASSRRGSPPVGPSALLHETVPRLADDLGHAAISEIMCANPARAWTLRGPTAP